MPIEYTLVKRTGSVPSHLSLLQQILSKTEVFACNLPSCSPTSFSLMTILPYAVVTEPGYTVDDQMLVQLQAGGCFTVKDKELNCFQHTSDRWDPANCGNAYSGLPLLGSTNFWIWPINFSSLPAKCDCIFSFNHAVWSSEALRASTAPCIIDIYIVSHITCFLLHQSDSILLKTGAKKRTLYDKHRAGFQRFPSWAYHTCSHSVKKGKG